MRTTLSWTRLTAGCVASGSQTPGLLHSMGFHSQPRQQAISDGSRRSRRRSGAARVTVLSTAFSACGPCSCAVVVLWFSYQCQTIQLLYPFALALTADLIPHSCLQVCPQIRVGHELVYGNEDCLYMNIFIPDPKNKTAEEGGHPDFPVLFWIFGGGTCVSILRCH